MINQETGEVIEMQNELFTALAEAQSKFVPVETDKSVDFTTRDGRRIKYNYASLAAIHNMARGPLTSNGLCVTQITIDNQLVTILGHKSGQSIRSIIPLPQSNDLKTLGGNLSYLKRYQYTAIIGAVVHDEDDENAVETKTSDPKPPKPSQQPPNRKKERPLSPNDLKDALTIKAAKFTGNANERQRKYAMSSLLTLCNGNDDIRHALGGFLFGKTSSTEWTSGECSSIIEWAGATKANDYTPTEEAFLEAELIIDRLVKSGMIETPKEVESKWMDGSGDNPYIAPTQDEIPF